MKIFNRAKEIITVENTSFIKFKQPVITAYQKNEPAELALKQVCYNGLLKVLLQMGIDRHADISSIDALRRALQVTDRYERLFEVLINFLMRGHYLELNNGKITIPYDIKQQLAGFHPADSINQLVEDSMAYAPYANLAEACLAALKEILTGKVPATDIIFPDGSFDLVSGIYKGNYQADYFNELLAEMVKASVAAAIKHAEPGAKIKILEVGAGTGGSSVIIFDKLAAYKNNIEYVYTDVSKSFLMYADEHFKAVAPYIKTQLFNIEQSPRIQDMPVGEYDLVIGANVVHATKNISVTLQHIKALLKKDGLLMLNEIATTDLFTSLTFGLLDGWWLYEDKELRLEGSPGLSAESWADVLTEVGFEEPSSSPLNCGASQQIVVAKSDGVLVIQSASAGAHSSTDVVAKKEKGVTEDESALQEQAQTYLKTVFARVLKMDAALIDVEAPFESLGIDSILVGMLAKELSKDFGTIPATTFFEYSNISELSEYFLEHHAAYFNPVEQQAAITRKADSEPASILPPLENSYNPPAEQPFTGAETVDSIAIIGLSGRYPGARNLDAFWENLKSGTDSISVIPSDRFNINEFYNEEKGREGKISSKYGGFIDGVDEFDPLFFNMAPKLAERVDPQERLFLQTVWETIEDAGYTPKQLSQKASKDVPVRTGVYVGVMYEEYQLLGANVQGDPLILGSSPASIANRVSYFCDFNGPSMAIDTMCSSSLTAIHLACKDLRSGDADVAIAGGVNVSIHPNKFMALSQATFLSARGKCESFGNEGDGFVAGEGVGAVLLKPLSKAIADGDHIYGVIKGSAVNHGGRNNGYTVPGVKGQAAVVRDAMQRAGINAKDYSYIEAHGTGTSLGDPIEIAGLTRAFNTDEKQYCSIGSVKSNIGHCESAAGISGVTKVLLQLKHKQLVPSLHSSVLNSHIDFANSPFRVQQQLADWNTENNRLRIAGVSSFGAGGSNAHLIIEEYRAPEKLAYSDASPALILLSAKNSNRLYEQAANLKKHLELNRNIPVHDIAYTLQVGREAMDERLAFVSKDTSTLIAQLTAYLGGKQEGFTSGNVKKAKHDMLLKGKAGEAFMQQAMKEREPHSLAQLWVNGVQIDWTLLYPVTRPNKISLPTYAFARERCWVPVNDLRPVENTGDILNTFQHNGTGIVAEPKKETNSYTTSASPINTEVATDLCYTPVWEVCEQAGERAPLIGSGKHLLVTGSSGEHFADELKRMLIIRDLQTDVTDSLEQVPQGLTDIYLLQGLISAELPLQEGIAQRELAVFKTIKLLLSSAYKDAKLNITVFTLGTQSILPADLVRCGGSGIPGLVGSLAKEQPLWNIRMIDLDRSAALPNFEKLLAIPFDKEGALTALRGDTVYARKLYPATLGTGKNSRLKKNGIYVILGGAGGIGKVTTEYLVKAYQAQVIWLGRSALNNRIVQMQDEIEAVGVRPMYISCNANDRSAIEEAYEEVIDAFGSIDGLFHSAIVLNDMLLKNMEEADFRKSFDPKSLGSHHFTEVFSREPLDFICFYSSIESQSSAPGQANYAAGCTYKDSYAQSIRQSTGTPVYTINWGYWGDVGVASDEAFREQFELMGIGSISAVEGMHILEQVLSNHETQVIAIKLLDKERPAISSIVTSKSKSQTMLPASRETETSIKAGSNQELTAQLAKIAADLIGLAVEEFDVDESFMDYGFDSISGTALVKNINHSLDITLKPTDIFNHPNIGQLSDFIWKTFGNKLQPAAIPQPGIVPAAAPLHFEDSTATDTLQQQPESSRRRNDTSRTRLQDVAIIGMSGQFGSANNLEEYWAALKEGRSLIEEVPAERWDKDAYYSPDKSAPDKTYSKWGGFIKDADKFDPLFFKISGSEAETMDPQQRLFLMHCWKAIEDAAINPRTLKSGKCGVYVGVGPGDYLTSIEGLAPSAMWGNSNAILASRISYFLDLKGPAISIDSACSSSLVAMDMGCASLQRGDADIIISGAVTIMNTANFYTMASKAGMLSPDGTCYAFDDRANGFVPGEGVGVVIMKRLEDAERDGDHIYGIIRGSMTNQDGATNGIFAPSAVSQQELEQDVYKKFNIHPETISYVEAHGTGTSLGDPIEFEALTAAFKSFTQKKQFCGLGSVKTNVGHTLLAAGMAGVMKILLALKHKQLPATLNYNAANALIDVTNSPFKIQDKLEPWESPVGQPRRAAINSFGFSGTNAHMVIEEYQGARRAEYVDTTPAIVVLSAKNMERLKEQAANLKKYVEQNANANLYDIAYTLQMGREAMEERLALTVATCNELVTQLNAYLKGSIADVQTGNARRNNLSFALKGESGKAYIDITIRNKECRSLASLWVNGTDIDWQLLYKSPRPSRISLPGYAFAMDRYWLAPSKSGLKVSKTSASNDQHHTGAAIVGTGNFSPSTMQKNNCAETQNKTVNKGVLTEQLMNLLSASLKIPVGEFRDDVDLQEYGVDSVSTMKFLKQAEEHFAVEIAIEDLMSGRNIADLATIIGEKLNNAEAIKPNGNPEPYPETNSELQPNLAYKDRFESNYASLIPAMDRQFVDYKGIRLEVIVSGEGKETMVLLPPVDCTAAAWMAQLEELKKKYHVIVPHYPGYGLSEFQQSLATLSEIAEQVIHILKALNVSERVHLVGWSMGGFIAQILAEKYASHFQSLTLVNTTSKLEVASTITNGSLMFENLRKDFVGNLFRLAATPFSDIDENAIKGSFNNQVSMFYALQVIGHDYRDKVSRIKLPTMIISGGQDTLTPPRYGQYLNEQIEGSGYHELKIGQHYIPLFHPQFFNRRLLNFVSMHSTHKSIQMLTQ